MNTTLRNTDIEKKRYLQLVQDFLCTMIPGGEVDPSPFNAPRSKKLAATFENGNQLYIKPFPDSTYVYMLKRSQPFSSTEQSIITTFNQVMSVLLDQWDNDIWHSQANSLLPKFVSGATTGLIPHPNSSTLTSILTTMLEWSEQTYEGQRIAFSVGIELSTNTNGPKFADLVRQDFSKVISNGFDTIVRCSLDGFVIGHETFDESYYPELFAPVRYGAIANWAQGVKIAVCLNRNGEVLVFAKNQLVFAKRRGLWRYFAHKTNVDQIAFGAPKTFERKVRQALYLSALDVSFSRTGGCVGLVKQNKSPIGLNKPVARQDDLRNSDNLKCETLRAILSNNFNFLKIDRRLRQELLALDGATVLDYKGRIIAAGAILQIPAGSTGGGRTTAAKILSKYGMGIKISNDGYVDIYAPHDPEPRVKFG